MDNYINNIIRLTSATTRIAILPGAHQQLEELRQFTDYMEREAHINEHYFFQPRPPQPAQQPAPSQPPQHANAKSLVMYTSEATWRPRTVATLPVMKPDVSSWLEEHDAEMLKRLAKNQQPNRDAQGK